MQQTKAQQKHRNLQQDRLHSVVSVRLLVWNRNFIILTQLSSLVALEVSILTGFGISSDKQKFLWNVNISLSLLLSLPKGKACVMYKSVCKYCSIRLIFVPPYMQCNPLVFHKWNWETTDIYAGFSIRRVLIEQYFCENTHPLIPQKTIDQFHRCGHP